MIAQTFFRDTQELHRRMQDVCQSIEVEYEPEAMTRLTGDLVSLLIPHIETEEEVLYATLEKVVDHWQDRNVLLEAHQAHKVIIRLVEEMQNTSPHLEEFQGIVLLLNRLMTIHIDQEEDLLYDMANRYLSYDAFSALAKQMREVQKRRLEEVKEEARRSKRVPTVFGGRWRKDRTAHAR